MKPGSPDSAPFEPSLSETAVPAPRSTASILLLYWLPLLVWCLVIFGASSDSRSTQRTSRFIGPLVRWLIPGASDATVSAVQTLVRKSAHFTEYAILALLLWRVCRAARPALPWRQRDALLAFAGATFFAVTDEIHQAFVPNRQAHPLDVLIDALGAAAGLLALRAWLRRRERKRR